MAPITLTIASIASLLVWRLSPLRALIVFFAVTLLYPQFLTLKVGTIDFSAGRIVILVLFARLLLRTRLLQEMRWTLLDKVVMVVFLAGTLARTFNVPLMRILENEGGAFVSVFMPYIAIRAIVVTKKDFRGLVSGLVLIGLVLAVLGGYQSVTGNNPMGFMKNFDAWEPTEQLVLNRFGLFRADVSFGQYIAFGLFFTILLPLALVLHKRETNPLKTFTVLVLLTIGCISSMSSAPLFAFVICALLAVFYPFRRYTVVLIGTLIASVAFLELFSDGHFYEGFTKFALNSSTASYRIGLINEALGGGMDGHWLFGYGDIGISIDAINTDFHWKHKDLTNVYISRLAEGGLLALIPFIVMFALFYRCLYVAWRASRSFEDRWMVWCLSTSLIGLSITLMTVGTVSHLKLLLYMLIAFAGCMPMLVGEEAKKEKDPPPQLATLLPLQDGGVPRGIRHPDNMLNKKHAPIPLRFQ